jgi:hypothetical protein
MKCVLSKAGKFFQLILAIGGISLLLASCANTNEKTANVNSAFPINYNAGPERLTLTGHTVLAAIIKSEAAHRSAGFVSGVVSGRLAVRGSSR